MKKLRTSIVIDGELWKLAKIEAIKNDMDVSELLDVVVREYLDKKNVKVTF